MMDLVCEICYNDFDEENCRPRMLSCGHTHCQSCIERFIEFDSPCPMCNEFIYETHVSDVPVNFYVLSMLKNDPESNFMCMKCYKILSGSCVTLSHKNCEKVRASDALTEVQVDMTSDLEVRIELAQKSNEKIEKYIKRLLDSLKDLKESINKVETKIKEETELKKISESLLQTLNDEKEIEKQNNQSKRSSKIKHF